MQPTGQFLTECAARLAPFERPRVGRMGCAVALLAMALAGAALWSGNWSPDPAALTLGGVFRRLVACGFGAVLGTFVVYAVVETLVERSVFRSVEAHVRDTGGELDTLARAADARKERLAGGRLLAALIARVRDVR